MLEKWKFKNKNHFFRTNIWSEEAYWGRDKIAEFLIEHGANVDAKEKDEWTPLHLAAESGISTKIHI